MSLSRPLRLFLLLLPLLGGLLSMDWAGRQARQQALRAEGEQVRKQLDLYAGSLQTLIERFRSLPAVLALDPDLRAALAGPIDGELQQRLNLKLESINLAARSSTLELLDRTGLAVAASNWNLPTSYVGHNYGFRPYFRQTIAQGSGRFYAVGVISGIPGYFLSHAVRAEDGSFLGAIVVKLEFPDLERQWNQTPDLVWPATPRASCSSPTTPVGATANWNRWIPWTASNWRRPGNTIASPDTPAPPDLAQLRRRQPSGAGGKRRRREGLPLAIAGPAQRRLDPALAARHREHPGRRRHARLAAAGTWLALVFLGLFLHQRWRIARLRQRSREELERLVEQRTADLRTAQDGLVQAAKLAALGQMSAALAHEINQPLTAQRMQLASLRLLLDAGRHDEARQALPRIDQMLERMAALTGHLKTFARKSAGGLRERIELGHVVEQAQQLLLPRIRAERVEIEQALLWPAWVMGDAIRLEQVLVNLLRNALDAVAGQERPWIRLALQRLGGDWVLSVADNGGGIPAEHLGSVFDPFFTTKPVGEGLGLGLAVSYGIVHELGGRLQVANAEAGAVFSLILPAAPMTRA